MLGPNEWAHVKKVFQLLHETLEVEVDEGENCKSALTAEMKEQILLYGHSGTCKSHGKGGIVTGLLSLLNNVDERVREMAVDLLIAMWEAGILRERMYSELYQVHNALANLNSASQYFSRLFSVSFMTMKACVVCRRVVSAK